MGSVFYAKRCNNTIFFDGLATKKTRIKNCSILVRSLKNSLDAININTQPAPTTADLIQVTARIALFVILLMSNKVD
jgi:hypothetical protein